MAVPADYKVVVRMLVLVVAKSPVSDKNTSTLSFNEVPSVWPYVGDSSVYVPTLRFIVLQGDF